MSQTLQTVAVIGAGTMGAGIAEVAAAAGHPVLLYDIATEALTRAVEGIRQRLAARVARGKLTADQADALVSRLVPVTELAALADAWLVIEAASERPDVKKALFSQLAAICSPSTLLTSNTSSISITAIAADVKHPERVAGLHFFNPAPVMKLVEVVSGLATSPEVVEQLCRCVTAWGKQPVRCRSTPGFIVNRVARPFYAEAWRAPSPVRCLTRSGRTAVFCRRWSSRSWRWPGVWARRADRASIAGPLRAHPCRRWPLWLKPAGPKQFTQQVTVSPAGSRSPWTTFVCWKRKAKPPRR